jgi:hypothetical protein
LAGQFVKFPHLHARSFKACPYLFPQFCKTGGTVVVVEDVHLIRASLSKSHQLPLSHNSGFLSAPSPQLQTLSFFANPLFPAQTPKPEHLSGLKFGV